MMGNSTEKEHGPATRVMDAEWEHLQNKRRQVPPRRDNLRGLAISGGGIRSASFALGVLQALQARGVLKKLEYLSTVSGGGYIGSSLTWFLHQYKKECSLDGKVFPFGDKEAGAKESKRNTILDYIRQHGKYLTPGQGLNYTSLLALVIRGMLLGLLVYFPLLTVLLYVCRKIQLFIPVKKAFPAFGDWLPSMTEWLAGLNGFFLFAIFCGAMFVALSLIFSVCTYCVGGNWHKPYVQRTRVQKRLGYLLMVLGLALVLGTLPHASKALGDLFAPAVAGGSVFMGAIGGLAKFLSIKNAAQKESGAFDTIMPVVAALLLIYGLLLGAFLLSAGIPGMLVALAIIVWSVFFGLMVNLNYVSLHRMYRDRLMEAFLPDMKSVMYDTDSEHKVKICQATEANAMKLCDKIFRDPEVLAPYHLINTNVILVDSAHPRYRGRGGDNFILSPLYCGSDATDWCLTEDFMKGDMTLASAMAISGAAVNPHTGVAGQGLTRNSLVSLLMTMLNLRLGYWARNPRDNQYRLAKPDCFMPGFWMGLLGRGFDEESYFVELSDGGHFDNTGLYELIRRRLKIIIVSDGSADPQFNFADLANAIERVRVDFGVNIRFNKGADLSRLLPGSAGDTFYEKRYNLAAKGYAIGTIEYPPREENKASVGHIIYIKSTLTPDLPADIYGYKSANPQFPDQSTADQFFDETQFEAYRELGYQLAKRMLEENMEILGLETA